MLSLVIVSFNTVKLLRSCLDSIRAHACEAEVIVVDNASNDGSADMVKAEFPEVKLVVLPVNVGFAAGNNAGLKLAGQPIAVLLNSDTELEDDSLTRCASWMVAQPKLGAASPRLLGKDNMPQQCAYPFPSIRKKLREAMRLGSLPGPGDLVKTGWLAGTALFLRQDALRQIGGGLDDGFFMYWEDADLSWRLRQAGWEFGIYEEGYIRHHGGASGGGKDEARRPDLHAWYVWGQHRWFAKHRSWLACAALWMLDGVDVLRKLLRGLVRPSKRQEWVHARVMARVLGWRLLGKAPPRPGQKQ